MSAPEPIPEPDLDKYRVLKQRDEADLANHELSDSVYTNPPVRFIDFSDENKTESDQTAGDENGDNKKPIRYTRAKFAIVSGGDDVGRFQSDFGTHDNPKSGGFFTWCPDYTAFETDGWEFCGDENKYAPIIRFHTFPNDPLGEANLARRNMVNMKAALVVEPTYMPILYGDDPPYKGGQYSTIIMVTPHTTTKQDFLIADNTSDKSDSQQFYLKAHSDSAEHAQFKSSSPINEHMSYPDLVAEYKNIVPSIITYPDGEHPDKAPDDHPHIVFVREDHADIHDALQDVDGDGNLDRTAILAMTVQQVNEHSTTLEQQAQTNEDNAAPLVDLEYPVTSDTIISAYLDTHGYPNPTQYLADPGEVIEAIEASWPELDMTQAEKVLFAQGYLHNVNQDRNRITELETGVNGSNFSTWVPPSVVTSIVNRLALAPINVADPTLATVNEVLWAIELLWPTMSNMRKLILVLHFSKAGSWNL